jgi:hypothetical protein
MMRTQIGTHSKSLMVAVYETPCTIPPRYSRLDANNNNNNNLYQFPSVTPVTGSQSLFAIVAGLLRLHVLNSSASLLFPLLFPTLFGSSSSSSFRRPGHYSLRQSVIFNA